MKSKNQIRQFHSDEFGSLDILMIDDKPYFPATECAKVLGYAKPENAIVRHCKGSLKRGVLSNGGMQDKKFIPEGDLYRLIDLRGLSKWTTQGYYGDAKRFQEFYGKFSQSRGCLLRPPTI